MTYKGREIIKNCLICKNYNQHPLKCAHCDDYDKFKLSNDGRELYKEIFEQGYQAKCEEK